MQVLQRLNTSVIRPFTLVSLIGIDTCHTNIPRCLHSSSMLLKKKSGKGKSKTHAEHLWTQRQMKDVFVKKARYESYRCRSAFKLIEIDDKYHILQGGFTVIDCGAAPGSWLQVAVQRTKTLAEDDADIGRVIGIDLQDFVPVEGATILKNSDFTSVETQLEIMKILNGKKADVVLSDMAPNATGVKSLDHEQIVELGVSVIRFANHVLVPGGSCLMKLWQGPEQGKIEELLRRIFERVQVVIPAASRPESSELFILARNFRGLTNS